METKQHYGQIMAEGLFKTSEGLKSTLMAMNQFKATYTEELKDKIKSAQTTEERMKLESELTELSKPEVKSSEMMISQIDDAMSRLHQALTNAFKLK
jgi:hypothetical protein